MNLSKTTFLIFTISIIQILSTPKSTLAQSQFLNQWCGTTTYTPNSTYQTNLNTILHLISTNTQITNGFYNFSVGHRPDRVSSLALCRGDVPPTTCRSCLQDASNRLLLPNVCPNQKEAFGYSGYCSIFITNETISNQVQDQTPPWYVTNTGNVAYDLNNFNTTLYALMDELRNRAASGNSDLKYADGNMSLKGGQKIYGLVQCTPDLDKNNCMDCIDNNILDYLPTCCVNRTIIASEVKFAHPSCFGRYALQPFFGVGNVPNLTLPALQPSALVPNNGSSNITMVSKTRKRRNIKAISISISIGVCAILVIIFVFSTLSRRKKPMGTKPRIMVKFRKEEMKALQSLQFSLRTIKYATRNFCDDNKIGEGGFGMVYKGKLPNNGQEIAVKRLIRNKGQGDAEFKNEILILAGLRHRNLVKLEGFCLHRKEMILIYELVPNKSLDNFIFDPLKRPSMLWETRYKIINGIARGILYLHETSRLNIIHRDLKAANILLDEDFNPKIADFGMARLFDIDQTQASMASKVVGTLGYIAPEYALHRQVSVKSDVYSFGVLVLEIISGQKISSFEIDEENQEPDLLSFAWRNWIKGTPHNLVDPTLASSGSSFEILRCIQIGLLCVQANPSDRPTMSSIDLMLSSNSVTLEVPSQPAFYSESKCLPNMISNWNSAISDESSSKSAIVSINDVSITELHPR